MGDRGSAARAVPSSSTTLGDVLLAGAAFLSVAGLIGLFCAAALAFEEPSARLLVASAVAVLAAPVAIVVHVTTSPRLTAAERRQWLRILVAGPEAWTSWGEYVSSRNRRATLEQIRARRHRGDIIA